jgi:hypothetical protein
MEGKPPLLVGHRAGEDASTREGDALMRDITCFNTLPRCSARQCNVSGQCVNGDSGREATFSGEASVTIKELEA